MRASHAMLRSTPVSARSRPISTRSNSQRKLGRNGPVVSSIGYGCMGISEFYGKTIPREEAVKLIRSAFKDHGVTFFDTADMYGKGLSEEILGEAVAPFRKDVVIASKCGINRKDEGVAGGIEMANSPEYIKRACERSLRNLKMDQIDLYYLHRYDPVVPIETSMNAMKELIAEGKIRYVGLSEVSSEVIRRAHAVLGEKLVAVQTEYSFQTRAPAEAVLPTCRELGISFVAYSPVARGLLTGAYRDPSFFGREGVYDIRTDALPRFQAGNIERNLRLTDAIKSIADRKGVTPAQLSLAWLLAQGKDIIPIPGTSNPKHLKENMEAAAVVLSPDDLTAMEAAYNNNPVAGMRYAEAVFQVFKMQG